MFILLDCRIFSNRTVDHRGLLTCFCMHGYEVTSYIAKYVEKKRDSESRLLQQLWLITSRSVISFMIATKYICVAHYHIERRGNHRGKGQVDGTKADL